MSNLKIKNDMTTMLKKLFLFHTERHLPELLEEAVKGNMAHKDFLILCLSMNWLTAIKTPLFVLRGKLNSRA